MGAVAKPVVNVVIPTLKATWLMPHSSINCPEAAAYEPAVIAVRTVTALESQVVYVFRDSDHVNGEMRFRRSGGSGGLATPFF